MTHMLPRACDALEPYLRRVITDRRFWDGKFDKSHVGDIDVHPLPPDDLRAFWERYSHMPSPLKSPLIDVRQFITTFLGPR